MRRLFLLLVLVLVSVVLPGPAHAARVWSEVQYPARPAPDAVAADVAADGTSVEAWSTAERVMVRLDDGSPVRVAPPSNYVVAAAGEHGNAVVAWWGQDGPTAVFAKPDGSFSAPDRVVARSAFPQAVRMDPDGDAVIVVRDDDQGHSAGAQQATAFRPAGGTFGAPANFDGDFEDLAISPTGEAVIATSVASYENYTSGQYPAAVVTRSRDGALVPTQLASTLGPVRNVAVDAHGRAIAIWSGRAAFRTADGVWKSPVATDLSVSDLAVDPDGDLVAVGSTAFIENAIQVVTGSLANRTLSDPVTIDHGPSPATNLALGMAPDGTAVIAEHDTSVPVPEGGVPAQHRAAASIYGPTVPQVRVIRREGTGAFNPPQVVACYPPDDFAHGLGVAGVTSTGAATLIVNAGLVHDAPGPDPASDRACGSNQYVPGRAVYSEPPVAGRPFTVSVSVARPGFDADALAFTVDGQAVTGAGASVTLSFPTPGQHSLTVQSRQTSQATGRQQSRSDAYTIDVAAPALTPTPTAPALSFAGVQHTRAVLRRGVAVSATGVPGAVFELRHGPVRFGRSAGPRIRLNARGRRYVRRHAVAVMRVVLIRNGAPLLHQRIRVL